MAGESRKTNYIDALPFGVVVTGGTFAGFFAGVMTAQAIGLKFSAGTLEGLPALVLVDTFAMVGFLLTAIAYTKALGIGPTVTSGGI